MSNRVASQIKIPACYMRGGTSKGVFFLLDDLPEQAQTPGQYRDDLLLRIIGSPDPYGKQIDGMGGATSSTSKVVILSKSNKPGHDVDYLFGQVSIDRPFIDWTGNCGNLTAAVGLFAINKGLIEPEKILGDISIPIRIWQQNIAKTIVTHIPMENGVVIEQGSYILDGVAFPGAEIAIEFLQPIDDPEDLFPNNLPSEYLDVPGVGHFTVTMINVGIPVVFLLANELGLTGTELQDDVNHQTELLARIEKIRAFAALRMGLIKSIAEAEIRQHSPKIAYLSPAQDCISVDGKILRKTDMDFCMRAFSMGQLHHAMMGTVSVAIAVAAAIPGTLIYQFTSHERSSDVTFGHPSGTLTAGAQVSQKDRQWTVEKVCMSRSARTIMDGHVYLPQLTEIKPG